jgi:hypothetical protein
MKRWLGILLMVAMVCVQAIASVGPRPLSGHERACKCCGCGGMDCCVVPVAPAPAAPTPVAATSLQKSVPAAARTTTAIAWLMPEATPQTSASFSPSVLPAGTQSLLQRLCVWLI